MKLLDRLAVDRRLSASSQNQATNAIVFLYQHVLAGEVPQDHLGCFAAERSARPGRVPTVLGGGEVTAVLAAIRDGATHRLMAELPYGTGMRLMECCTLRVRDLDLERAQIVVRGAASACAARVRRSRGGGGVSSGAGRGRGCCGGGNPRGTSGGRGRACAG